MEGVERAALEREADVREGSAREEKRAGHGGTDHLLWGGGLWPS